MNRIWQIVFIVLNMMLAVLVLHAQNVTNISSIQAGKIICMNCDLDKETDVTLFVSTDDGSTYPQLYCVSGNVGKNVSAGHKTLVWDVLAEWETPEGGNVMFKAKTQGKEDLTFTVNGVTFKMIYVEGGTFNMGCSYEQGNDCGWNAKPLHQVTLSDFWMGETEVTRLLWQAVMGSNSSNSTGGNLPVVEVSWGDCQRFCNKLNEMLANQLPDGLRFALPTEAQWEYAARGGQRSKGFKYSGSNDIDEVAWYWRNSGDKYLKGKEDHYIGKSYKYHYRPHYVKFKAPNELGLYDMSGNALEWCSDWYGKYSSSAQTNPTGPSSGSDRVRRGGNWGNRAGNCRVSSRDYSAPDNRYGCGFRLSLVRQ